MFVWTGVYGRVKQIGRRYVIDSNKLQTDDLRRFLAQQSSNFAVLPNDVWIEIYKQKSIEAVAATLSVIGDFPEQIIILKSNSDIVKIDPRALANTDKMQQSDVAHTIRIMLGALADIESDPHGLISQIQQSQTRAASLSTDLLEFANDIRASRPEMERQMFTSKEVRLIRTDEEYTSDMFANIFGAAEQIWEGVSKLENSLPKELNQELKTKTYLYRFSLSLVVHLLWWIKNGSQSQERLDRIRNDLVDLSIVICGTYYDGIMTADQKAAWIANQLMSGLRLLEEYR